LLFWLFFFSLQLVIEQLMSAVEDDMMQGDLVPYRPVCKKTFPHFTCAVQWSASACYRNEGPVQSYFAGFQSAIAKGRCSQAPL